MKIDYQKLSRAGVNIDNSEFVFYVCAKCGNLALYDEEKMILWGDADNLHSGSFNDDPETCSICGSECEPVDLERNELHRLYQSPWAPYLA